MSTSRIFPPTRTAVSINVTVVDGTEGSFLTVHPTGAARPTTSTVNWDSAGAEANSATVSLGTDQSVTIYNLKGTVNVVIDLLGYFAPIPGAPTGPTTPTTPTTPSTQGAFIYATAQSSSNRDCGRRLCTFALVNAETAGAFTSTDAVRHLHRDGRR